MGTSPALSQSGHGRTLSFQDQSDDVGAYGDRGNRLENMRQELQGMTFIVIGQFN
jgi:hypothetical protein